MEADRSHNLQDESTGRAHGGAPEQGGQAPDLRKSEVYFKSLIQDFT